MDGSTFEVATFSNGSTISNQPTPSPGIIASCIYSKLGLRFSKQKQLLDV